MSTNTLEAGARPAAEIDAEKALVSKVAWRLMPLIMVCYLFAFLTVSTSASPNSSCKPTLESPARDPSL